MNERTNTWGDVQPTEYIGSAEPRPASFLGAIASLLGLGEWQRGERMGRPQSAPGVGYDALGSLLENLDFPAKGATSAVHYGAPLVKAALVNADMAGPLAAGMVKWGKKTHPQDFIARAMNIAELPSMQKAREAGLPYHASGTAINPIQQGVTNPWGLVFDLLDQLAVQHASPTDAAAEYTKAASGARKFMGTRDDYGPLSRPLRELYQNQGKEGAAYNEMVTDFAHPGVKIAGVMVPLDPLDDIGRAQSAAWRDYATQHDLPVFQIPHRLDLPDELFDLLQTKPMSGKWGAAVDVQGLPVKSPMDLKGKGLKREAATNPQELPLDIQDLIKLNFDL